MSIETVLFIIGGLGLLGLFLLLVQILRFFAARPLPTLIVAVAGALCLGLIDLGFVGLFELTKPLNISFLAGIVMGAWGGIHLTLLAALPQGSHEIAVSMIDYNGGCVWIFGSALGGAIGALIGAASGSQVGGLAIAVMPFVSVIAGIIGGILLGIPFLLVWIYLFAAPARVVTWARNFGK